MVEFSILFLTVEGVILLCVMTCAVTVACERCRQRACTRREPPLQQPVQEVPIQMPWIGLTELELQRLPEACHDGVSCREGCTVCMDDILDGQPTRMLPACRHVFHRNCIDKWISINAACPICRNDLLLSVYKVVDEAEAV